jgi:hypothetical protein
MSTAMLQERGTALPIEDSRLEAAVRDPPRSGGP